MKYILIAIIFGASLGYSAEYKLAYDNVTLNPIEWGVQDMDRWFGVSTVTVVAHSEIDPMLRVDKDYIRFNEDTNLLEMKSKSEIISTKNDRRKAIIIDSVKQLKEDLRTYLNMNEDGFDVVAQTTTIKNKLDTLKNEYDGL